MNSHRETMYFNDLVPEVGFNEKLIVKLLLLSALSNTSSTSFNYLLILSSEIHEPFLLGTKSCGFLTLKTFLLHIHLI